MSNLTLSVDEPLIKRARVRGIEEGTSLSAKVGEFLQGCENESPHGLSRQLAGDAGVSTQVLIELFHTRTGKQQTPADAAQALVSACTAWPVNGSDLARFDAAIERSIRQRLSVWDAMAVEAAQRAGARTPYSEDFGHGQRFDAVTVVNPFLA